MIYVFGSIILIAIVLLSLTFFMDDKLNDFEDQLEELSISTMQDTYQIRKKLKELEDELHNNQEAKLHNNQETEPVHSTNEVAATNQTNPLTVQKIYHLYQHGYSIAEIAKRTDLGEQDIENILKNNV